MNRLSIRLVAHIAGISFILNSIWENAQAPLYIGYTGFWQHFLICFWGALGDVAIILFLYGAFALRHRNIRWIESLSAKSVVPIALAGMILAVLIEYYALSVGRWSYSVSMPLFFGTKAGLLPVLQMTVLPYVIFYCARRNIKIV